MRSNPGFAFGRDFFFPDRNSGFKGVDQPAAGVECGGSVFGSGGDENDVVAGLDGSQAMHETGVDQCKAFDGFVAQGFHFRDDHARIGVETDFAYRPAFRKITGATDEAGDAADPWRNVAQGAQFGIDRMCEDSWRWQSTNPDGFKD